MLSYKPTVYEQIVIDFWNGKKLRYKDYKKELAERGFADKRYFDAYVEDMRFIRDMMLKDGFNRELAEKISGKYFNADETAQIFKVITDKKEIDFEGLKEALLEKGYTKKQLSSFTDDMNSVQKLIKNPKFNLRLAADIVKNYHPSNNKDVLRYALFDKEKQIVLEAEKMGMFQDGEVIEYDGYKRKMDRPSRQWKLGLKTINAPVKLKNSSFWGCMTIRAIPISAMKI